MTETEAIIILNAIPGLGNIRIRSLLDHFGSAVRVLSLKEKDFVKEKRIPGNLAAQICGFDRGGFLRNERDLLRQHRVEVVTYKDDCFPKNLNEIPDAPVALYIKGTMVRDNDLALAVVGSRRASIYGITTAEKLAGQLADLGMTIVSGMARGIDTAAHRGCLKANGKTIAVLGCGLSHVYPEENRGLLNDIARSGAVISEFPMGIPPFAYNFPRRNRIISGLSLGVLVIEASLRSGALITGNFALEQGREVFAVPGKIDHPNAQGVNRLIKQGAKLVTGVEDILEELTVHLKPFLSTAGSDAADTPSQTQGYDLSEPEQDLFHHIHRQPVSMDDLVSCCDWPVGKMMDVLLRLELKHCIKQLPGKFFVRA